MPQPAEDRESFLAAFPVSRETEERLARFAEILKQWNQGLGLISASTVETIWTRHFLDSAQLLPLIPEPERPVLDMGSGAGFPGMVLAILGLPQTHLIEHNMRKVAFLRTIIAELGLPVTVHAQKVEGIRPFPAGAVVARALSPLTELIGLGRKFLVEGGVLIFPKGRRAEEELREAEKLWRMKVERFPSLTSPDSTIFRLSEVRAA